MKKRGKLDAVKWAADARANVLAVEKAAKAAGVTVRLEKVLGDFPADAILSTAKRRKCDLIVMASHGRSGLKAVLLGSETQKVLAHAGVPVLVHR